VVAPQVVVIDELGQALFELTRGSALAYNAICSVPTGISYKRLCVANC
jgi:hypothetical protein